MWGNRPKIFLASEIMWRLGVCLIVGIALGYSIRFIFTKDETKEKFCCESKFDAHSHVMLYRCTDGKIYKMVVKGDQN